MVHVLRASASDVAVFTLRRGEARVVATRSGPRERARIWREARQVPCSVPTQYPGGVVRNQVGSEFGGRRWARAPGTGLRGRGGCQVGKPACTFVHTVLLVGDRNFG